MRSGGWAVIVLKHSKSSIISIDSTYNGVILSHGENCSEIEGIYCHLATVDPGRKFKKLTAVQSQKPNSLWAMEISDSQSPHLKWGYYFGVSPNLRSW